MNPPRTPEPINKPLVGVIGVVCLLSAAVCYFWFPEQSSAQSAFTRIGIVMTALFLALPKRGETIVWGRMAPMLVVATFAIVLSKRLILVILPLLVIIGIILTIFRPRTKTRPPRE